MTGDGARAAQDILSADDAAIFAAEIGNDIRDLLAKNATDPDNRTMRESAARLYAQLGLFYVGYVAMFERNP